MPDFRFKAFRTNEFVVEIEGIESPGIQHVTGLDEGTVDAIEQPDGGSNIKHKVSSGLITSRRPHARAEHGRHAGRRGVPRGSPRCSSSTEPGPDRSSAGTARW